MQNFQSQENSNMQNSMNYKRKKLGYNPLMVKIDRKNLLKKQVNQDKQYQQNLSLKIDTPHQPLDKSILKKKQIQMGPYVKPIQIQQQFPQKNESFFQPAYKQKLQKQKTEESILNTTITKIVDNFQDYQKSNISQIKPLQYKPIQYNNNIKTYKAQTSLPIPVIVPSKQHQYQNESQNSQNLKFSSLKHLNRKQQIENLKKNLDQSSYEEYVNKIRDSNYERQRSLSLAEKYSKLNKTDIQDIAPYFRKKNNQKKNRKRNRSIDLNYSFQNDDDCIRDQSPNRSFQLRRHISNKKSKKNSIKKQKLKTENILNFTKDTSNSSLQEDSTQQQNYEDQQIEVKDLSQLLSFIIQLIVDTLEGIIKYFQQNKKNHDGQQQPLVCLKLPLGVQINLPRQTYENLKIIMLVITAFILYKYFKSQAQIIQTFNQILIQIFKSKLQFLQISLQYNPHQNITPEGYVLALTWAGSTCQLNRCTHYGRDHYFNIHGLWPNSESQQLQFCNRVSFYENEIRPDLKKQLDQYWNSYYSSNWRFIFHEVKKHGSCWNFKTGNLRQMPYQIRNILNNYNPRDQDQILNTYIQVTMSLSDIYNPYEILQQKKVMPGNRYRIKQILKPLYDKFGYYTIAPICTENRSGNKMYLQELRYCLDLNFNPTRCDKSEVKRKMHYCGLHGDLYYPNFPRN